MYVCTFWVIANRWLSLTSLYIPVLSLPYFHTQVLSFTTYLSTNTDRDNTNTNIGECTTYVLLLQDRIVKNTSQNIEHVQEILVLFNSIGLSLSSTVNSYHDASLTIMKSFYLSFIFMSITGVSAFTPSSSLTSLSRSNGKQESKSTYLQMKQQDKAEAFRNGIAGILTASAIAVSTIGFNTDRAFAYDDFSDNDVDTVSNVVQSLKDAQGDAAASFKVFESINDIITEGKGVGGMISSCKLENQKSFPQMLF